MKRFLRWLVAIPVIVLVVVFAVANREWTTVSLDPFSSEPALALHMPLWALLFLGLFIGLIIGYAACWWAQGKWRRALKETRRELSRQQVATAPAATLRPDETGPTPHSALPAKLTP